jgi:serine/threonine protein kinase
MLPALSLRLVAALDVSSSSTDPLRSSVPLDQEGIGGHIGPYRLLEVLGEGGMGTVYAAEQEYPVRRRVAVKVIRPGLGSRDIIARFEAERQAQAMMDHANIAKVFDAGATDAGLPYFVMELVTGVPITQYCGEQRLTLRQRIELFLPACRAIQHAHQKGIIHRDIKPSNVLVTIADGKPVPKVIDFGLVKATEPGIERTMLTEYGMVLGTLEYMSPEQAEIDREGVDTRTDIFSLGVMLYTLITGTTPFGPALRKASLTEAIRVIKEEQPPRPSTRLSSPKVLIPGVPGGLADPGRMVSRIVGDLDWIVMKCLEKDRARRYESAGALARDIECYLADEPVEACPPSTTYRMRRFTRKHRKPIAAAAALMIVLVAGVVTSTWQALRAARAERRAIEAATLMQTQRDDTRLALTRQVAERLDGDLRRLEMAAQVLATTVAQRADWREPDLDRWMRAMLEQDERLFGMAVALEPRAIPGRSDFCLYAFRSDTSIETKQLLPPAYVPIYREWEWYRKPIAEQRSVWSEPYVDIGGGNIPMVTVSSPIRRAGSLVGVLTFDLSVRYFDVLRGWLRELQPGKRSYGFVLSQSGVVISHPSAAYDFARVAPGRTPSRITDLGDEASFKRIADVIRTQGTGSASAIDPTTGREATFLFAPVRSAGWTFVAVVE